MLALLFAEYKTMNPSKKIASKILTKSLSTLDVERKAGIGCSYKQDTPLSNVYYPLTAIVEYLTTDLVAGA